MKTLVKITLGLFIGITFISCSALMQTSSPYQKLSDDNIENTRKSWIGSKESEVYAFPYWGVPDNTYTDGQGGKIISYSRKNVAPNLYDTSKTVTVNWITTFYIDSTGTIYDVKMRREVYQ